MVLVFATSWWSGVGDAWAGRVTGAAEAVTKLSGTSATRLVPPAQVHHRQLRSESITTKLQPPLFPSISYSPTNTPNMSLTYGTGGATAALGVVGLCMYSAQGRRQ